MTFVLTSDVDFVSDDILKTAYKSLQKVPMTIFMTGDSKYLREKLNDILYWECEPHPNFCEGSTHGSSYNEVFDSVASFLGEGLGFRCHRYYSSNDIEERFVEKGYVYSSNLCTDLELVSPFKDRCGLIQFPVFMEDGGYLKYHGVPHIEDIQKKIVANGIYVFNFHPIHLALNSSDFSLIRRLKDSMSPDRYGNMTSEDIYSRRNYGYGMSDFLDELLSYAQKKGIRLLNLKQCYEEYQKNICF